MNFITDISTRSMYIHFESPEGCQKFKESNLQYEFGNSCCSGKGVEILNINSDEINSIRRKWEEWKKVYQNAIENLRRKRAARIIKEAWTKYAWDPKFSLCRRLYIQRMENIGVNYED